MAVLIAKPGACWTCWPTRSSGTLTRKSQIADPRNPVVGTRLIREWNGVEHTITVLRDGFEWQGRPYKSLSAIARAITGTRWNGYRFFGLRERKRGND